METIIRLYRSWQNKPDFEECFCFGWNATDWLPSRLLDLAEFIQEEPGMRIHPDTRFTEGIVGEVGPRPAFATPFSSNAVDSLQKSGFPEITRVEKFRRYCLPFGVKPEDWLAGQYDPMTECVYLEPIQSFGLDITPAPVTLVPVKAQGLQALAAVNARYGLGMSQDDMQYYLRVFMDELGRDPTDVECFQLGQMGSNHCRHRDWNACIILPQFGSHRQEDKTMPYSLIQLVQEPYRRNPGNSVIGFHDNASSIRMGSIHSLAPVFQSIGPSLYLAVPTEIDGTCTVETHNHPTRISPRPGAETGIGGCYRDGHAVGRGGLILHSLAGFFTGNLLVPGYRQPWEEDYPPPASGATALQIMLEAPNGTWDYGNKYGIPVLGGTTRTVDMNINGWRWGYMKPIMLAGNVGIMHHAHAQKGEAEVGMKIVAIGGPAYRIGFGGGTASSQAGGSISQALDFNSVQRGDAEMGHRTRCVIEACVAMRDRNPIVSVHDQGAGGNCNVLTELVEKSGGRINIRAIRLGDTTLSVMEIWGAEFQERYGLLIRPEDLPVFLAICAREDCPCEVLGEVTGDGRIVVVDEQDGSLPVDLPIKSVISGLPRRVIRDSRPVSLYQSLVVPKEPDILTLQNALDLVLRLPSVGSKGFLVHHVDRSVGGRVVQSQCCGPLQLPVADASVSAVDFFGQRGIASAIGEAPLKTMLQSDAGIRMAIAEAVTNLAGVPVTDFSDIKLQGNIMWPGTKDGEMYKLYTGLNSGLRSFLLQLGIVEDGGKDSMSMQAKDASGATVNSPNTFVATLYAPVADVQMVVTPDLKYNGGSRLVLLDLGAGRNRLGGSAFGQVFNRLGEDCPDIEAGLLRRSFEAVQKFVRDQWILACHDRSDGGLIVTLLEMAMAGNRALSIQIPVTGAVWPFLFAEEAGLVLECPTERMADICSWLKFLDIPHLVVGQTMPGDEVILTSVTGDELYRARLASIRALWEETSFELEKLQINPDCARAEREHPLRNRVPAYNLTFRAVRPVKDRATKTPKVAVVRTTGSNGQLELAAMFERAGFAVHDVTMTDLTAGRLKNFNEFRGLLFPGGFANADVFGAGRAWALEIQRNGELRQIFAEFLGREDVFSFGPCNGCQFMTVLGWVPFQTMEPVPAIQPRFLRNTSRAFESRWSMVKVLPSPAIMFRGMAGSQLGIHVDHGEGRLWCPNPSVEKTVASESLAPLAYIDPNGEPTEDYPFNPNGSPHGWAGLCDRSGRHLAMMPHPERLVRPANWPYLPPDIKGHLSESPWMQGAYNLYEWC